MKLKTYLGRVYREIEKKAVQRDEELNNVLSQAERLINQEKDSKNKLLQFMEVKLVSECYIDEQL